MMEFTVSRVTATLCALMVLAALSPQLDVHNDRRMEDGTAAIAESFEGLLLTVSSTQATMMIDGEDVLPNESWTLVMDNETILVSDGTVTHIHVSKVPYNGGPHRVLHSSRMIISVQGPEGYETIHLQNVDTMSSTASANRDTSSSSL